MHLFGDVNMKYGFQSVGGFGDTGIIWSLMVATTMTAILYTPG